MVVVRGAYAYDAVAASVASGVACDPEEDMAVQSAREECDINTIVKRFGVTGQLPSGVRAPTYGDFTQVGDYQSAQNALIIARKAFMQMPAEVRSRFGNDPQAFVEFCSDSKNLAEMRKMGLAVPEKVVPPEVIQKVEVVNSKEKSSPPA